MLLYFLQEYAYIDWFRRDDLINLYGNIIVVLYTGFAFVYRIFVNIHFFIKYMYNIWLSYLYINKYGLNIVGFFHNFIYYFWYWDKWLNRRFIKRRKRFHLYYKFPNIKTLKLFLFIILIYYFFLIWQKRNLYLKMHLITRPFYIFLFSLLGCASAKFLFDTHLISSFFVINLIFILFYLNRK